jgi:predicted methyltransferase MtxX (methanogen marker protein 4)
MFAQLLRTTRTACSGQKARSFSIGIGLADPRIAAAVAGDLAAKLGSPAVTLAIYHVEGSFEPHPASERVQLHPSPEPVHEMISDFKAGRLHAIIRGQQSSSNFLAELKRQFSVERTYRLALLSTSAGQDFFFAPVGIDEGSDPCDKQRLIETAAILLAKIGIMPSFYLLSAGRLDDASRGERIGTSIRETIGLVDKLKQQRPPIAVQHGEILIEDAFDKGANTIIAPDGISGNLIYRTLLHLGSGHSHGAYYLGPGFPGPVMDTSRVGSVEEYVGAVVLALRLLISRE